MTISKENKDFIDSLIDYIDNTLSDGNRLHHVTRHVLGLYQRQPGGRQFRRVLSEGAHQATANSDLLRNAADVCAARRTED